MVLRKVLPRTKLSLFTASVFSGMWLLSAPVLAEDYFDLSLEQLLETQVLSVS